MGSNEVRDDGQRRRRNDRVRFDHSRVGSSVVPQTRPSGRQGRSLSSVPNVAAEDDHFAREALGERGKATAEAPLSSAPLLLRSAAQLELVPEPHRGYVRGERAELALEQRLPYHAVHALAAQADEPLLGRLGLEGLPIPDGSARRASRPSPTRSTTGSG